MTILKKFNLKGLIKRFKKNEKGVGEQPQEKVNKQFKQQIKKEMLDAAEAFLRHTEIYHEKYGQILTEEEFDEAIFGAMDLISPDYRLVWEEHYAPFVSENGREQLSARFLEAAKNVRARSLLCTHPKEEYVIGDDKEVLDIIKKQALVMRHEDDDHNDNEPS